MAFWGVEVKPGKPYTHLHDDSRGRLRVSQATLGNGKSSEKSMLQCNVGEKSPILLSNLIPDKAESCHLELEFEEFNDEVIFSVLGQRSVHLSGYYLGASGRSGGGEDESDSYGVDIAETESDHSGSYDSEGYESDFIDDDDIEMYSSPPRKSNVVIEEIVEDDKPANGNAGHRRVKKKNQVSDSDDNDSQHQLVKHNEPTILESEDEDGFPIFSLRTKKPVEDDAKILSKDKKRMIDSISPDANAARNAANKNEKSKKKKKGKIEDEKPVETISKLSTEKIVSVEDNQELVVKLDGVHSDDGIQNASVNIENKENDLAVKNDVTGTENVGKLKKKRKARVKKGKKSEDEDGYPMEAITDEVMDQDLPSESDKLPTEKEGIDSSPGAALDISGKQKKKNKKKGINTQEKNCEGKELSNSQDNRKMNEDSLASKQPNDNPLICDGDPSPATKQKKNKKNIENDSNISKELLGDLSEQKDKAQPKKTRTFPNGFIVEELSMGKPDGKRASRGCKVSVKYVGKLQNGVEFDSSGKKTFTFRLGIGEVIKGWDIGVEGMRVGDKRKLTIPPSLGYGKKDVGKIPANSWLVFDIELVSVK